MHAPRTQRLALHVETEKLEAYNTIAEPVFAPEGMHRRISMLDIHRGQICLQHVYIAPDTTYILIDMEGKYIIR